MKRSSEFEVRGQIRGQKLGARGQRQRTEDQGLRTKRVPHLLALVSLTAWLLLPPCGRVVWLAANPQQVMPILGSPAHPSAGGASTYTYVTWAYVAETASSMGSITSNAITLSSGDALVAFCRNSGGAGDNNAFSSTPSNTWSTLSSTSVAGTNFTAGYVLSAGSGSTTVTCTFTSNASYNSLIVLQYHHSGASASYDTSVASTGLSNTLWTSSVFSTVGNDLIVACATLNSGTSFTAGSIGGNTSTLRGVSGSSLSASGVDAGCEDTYFPGPQSSITATVNGGTTSTWGGSVLALK